MNLTNPFDKIDLRRRELLGASAAAAVAATFGGMASARAAAATPTGKPAAGGADPFASLKRIDAGPLTVGYADIGPADGKPVLLFHGWPYDIHAYAEVAPKLAAAGYRVIVPHLRGYGTTRLRDANAMRNGEQAALAVDAIAFMDALNIRQAVVAGFDWGARTVNILAALWPERCKAMVSVSGYLIGSQAAGKAPLPPAAELQWWYQFYFATERGRAGYAANTHEFSKLIWRLASPKWGFDDATFDRSAASFDNPDHVDIVIHNYRWRLGLAEGEAQFDELEKRLAQAPAIGVPTITMEGDANGAPHPEPAAYAKKFTGKYAHRLVTGGIGHNLPQEAPDDFVRAVIDADKM
ncbi:alpha/beta fold hydrolase [Nitrospirillum bahiense]|uniref:Pimeloyl-ACP methyl ester carboxylesterase n=2 Tax=Nitrospirillum amazonense TaxID=28077 RepID=A0A560FN98_9PROT|nr:alpha/beta hydrolase [Nitrospirillum amazonense]TWB23095.1 pimeloyl-ACP methyl ester carboxylesterase [Nitrospirillum amazonense]